MLTPANLREYQWRAIKFLRATLHAALFLDMGLGKTISLLSLIKALLVSKDNEIKVWLGVAPIRVMKSVWRQEAKKWSHTQDIQFSVVHGSENKRRAALAQPAHVYLINPEGLVWLLDWLDRLGMLEPGQFPFDGLFIDESSMFKASGTKRFKALMKVLHLFKRRVIMTGTPMPNSALELWPQFYIVDMGERLGGAFYRFRQRFFESQDYNEYTYSLRTGASRRITSLIRDVTLRLDAKDWLKLPPIIENDLYVDLPVNVMEQYKEFEKRMFLELSTIDVEAVSAATLSGRCHQIANGALYGDDRDTGNRTWEPMHDEKLKALDEIVGECGSPLLVCYQFKHDLARLRAAYPQGVAIDDFTPEEFELMWNDRKFPIAFGHPKSFGHGLNLQDGGHNVAFFSLTWSREQIDQVVARVGPTRQAQAGRYQPVTVHRIIARGTTDEAILLSNAAKQHGQQAQLDALKEYQQRKAKPMTAAERRLQQEIDSILEDEAREEDPPINTRQRGAPRRAR